MAQGEVIPNNVSSYDIEFTGLRPDYSNYFSITASSPFGTFYPSIQIETKGVSPRVKVVNQLGSSLTCVPTYYKEDIEIESAYLTYGKGNTKVEADSLHLVGLDPQTEYDITCTVKILYNGNNHATYTATSKVKTANLEIKPLQPKVISVGNVIVAAESNLDDEETNVGFEWRRTDWTDDFASNTGGAYLYEGMMEGYIRNLNAEKLWRCRPFYESNTGNRYYGEWVGLDPSNTSYFEPTVHTYAQVNVDGNSARVKGYAMRGSDNITSQGFIYWQNMSSVKDKNNAPSVPNNAVTVEVSGNVMETLLTGLNYESTYTYVAFVKTSEGETFYGEERSFQTGEDTTGFENLESDASTWNGPVTVVTRYNTNGQKIAAPQKGVNILRMSDGTVKKVLVK